MSDIVTVAWVLMGVLIIFWGIVRKVNKRKKHK
jgi:hypothetical protein